MGAERFSAAAASLETTLEVTGGLVTTGGDFVTAGCEKAGGILTTEGAVD